MLCEHLRPLEEALLASGQKETYRGQPWSDNCREWVYYDVVLDVDAIQRQFRLPACVRIHENLDPKSGTERGFYCTACKDAVVGNLNGPTKWPT
jgi:hypothetical protein